MRVLGVWTPGAGCRSTAPRKEPEVSQSNTDQAQAAETLTQETRTFIRQVRTKTRRKYALEDKICQGRREIVPAGRSKTVPLNAAV